MALIRRPRVLRLPIAQILDILMLSWPSVTFRSAEPFTKQLNIMRPLHQQRSRLDSRIRARVNGAIDGLLDRLANTREAVASHQNSRVLRIIDRLRRGRRDVVLDHTHGLRTKRRRMEPSR